MKKSLLIMPIMLLVGCTAIEQYLQDENVTCQTICNAQPHPSCLGFTWNISGSPPNCVCQYYCDEDACSTNSDCPSGEYCSLDSCTDSLGECITKPEMCADVWDPVCGCDGMTYSNDCFAANSGINIDYEGECVVTCNDSNECETDEYCKKDGCTGKGNCTVMPEICLAIYEPVCGCDGMNYSNACMAANAGINVASQGSCS